MIIKMRFFLLLYLALASPLISQQSRSSVEPFTETPPGNYEVVSLELRKGLRVNAKNTEPQILQLSFRERKLSNFWFIDHGWEAMHPHGGELQLGDKGISGDLVLRMYDVRGRNQAHAHLKFKVEREGNVFSGRMSGRVQATEAQDWQTSVKGAFVKPAGTFSEEASWPTFAGPSGNLSTSPNSPSLLEDLRQSQPRWRSEADVPVSYGNAADDRYPSRAAGCRYAGGSSSPVYADGVVYIGFYQPSYEFAPAPEKWFVDKWIGEPLAKYAKENNLIKEEVQAIEDHWRPIADDVVVAMDARTGETLWKTTWPRRTYNLQTHKHRGTFGVPLVAAGKVFYPDFHDGLEVMDAKTGKALWEFPKHEQPPETKWRPSGPKSQSPLLWGETLIWHYQDTTYGFKASTGKVLWENQNERHTDHSLRLTIIERKPYIFVVGQRHRESMNIRLINPDSGKTLWKEDLPLIGTYEGMFANVLAIQGDLLISYRHKLPAGNPDNGKIDKKKVTHHVNAWKLTTKGTQHIWEDEHLPPDEGPHLAISINIVYAVGDGQLRCLDLQTGKVLGKIYESGFPGKDGRYQAPGSNPLLIVAGDKLFLSPEGQHGVHGFILFDADPTKLTLLGDQEHKWKPPHATTTAYGRQPIVNPIVDGRAFFRGGNGIYCYDLRKQE